MISNTDQSVDQEKYGENFDRIFRKKDIFSYGDSISGTLKYETPPEIKDLENFKWKNNKYIDKSIFTGEICNIKSIKFNDTKK